jgi:hypothetical protein
LPGRHAPRAGLFGRPRTAVTGAESDSPDCDAVRIEDYMKHIFVVGLDDVHLAQLRTLPEAHEYALHPLLTYQEIKQQDQFPVERLLDEGVRMLRAFGPGVDAVVGYWDFPVSTVLPILRQALGLPGPTLEAVLACEHKYWSRRLQAEVAAAHVPPFCAVDPFADEPLRQISIDFPFWLKPVKSVLSHLGFRIDGEADFRAAIERIRAGIGRYADPFDLILAQARLPPAIALVDGRHCIAEGIISTVRQVTQEGYVYGGVVHVYGTIDSQRCGPKCSSFSRYQYPSVLPPPVLERMSAITARIMRHIGYDMAPFNIEYFWDDASDSIYLLEINPRISKSHAPLFQMVDGCYHHQVMIDLGLGRAPRFTAGGGDCAIAARFMVRELGDAVVARAPTPAEIAAAEAAVSVREGQRLSELRDQDSYTYEVAVIYVGGDSEAEIEDRFDACLTRLPLRFERCPA